MFHIHLILFFYHWHEYNTIWRIVYAWMQSASTAPSMLYITEKCKETYWFEPFQEYIQTEPLWSTKGVNDPNLCSKSDLIKIRILPSTEISDRLLFYQNQSLLIPFAYASIPLHFCSNAVSTGLPAQLLGVYLLCGNPQQMLMENSFCLQFCFYPLNSRNWLGAEQLSDTTKMLLQCSNLLWGPWGLLNKNFTLCSILAWDLGMSCTLSLNARLGLNYSSL